MKKVIVVIGIVLISAVLGVLTAGQLGERKQNRVSLVPLSEGNITMFGITVDKAADDEQVIAEVCYWTTYPGIVPKIARCSTTVIPALNNVRAVTDFVPVPLSDVMRVKVRVVKVTESENFSFKESQP